MARLLIESLLCHPAQNAIFQRNQIVYFGSWGSRLACSQHSGGRGRWWPAFMLLCWRTAGGRLAPGSSATPSGGSPASSPPVSHLASQPTPSFKGTVIPASRFYLSKLYVFSRSPSCSVKYNWSSLIHFTFFSSLDPSHSLFFLYQFFEPFRRHRSNVLRDFFALLAFRFWVDINMV